MITETEGPEGQFILLRFNPRRAARGPSVGAAEVLVVSEDVEMRLWMTRRDIEKNIKEFGPQQGLLDAKEAYRRNVDFQRPE